MDEAAELGNYLPLSFKSPKEQEYIAFLFGMPSIPTTPTANTKMGETGTFYLSAGAVPDVDTSAWEREIGERVYCLYGLTSDKSKIVEDMR